MYFNPRIEDVVFPGWKPRNAICYDGIDQYTGKWCRIDTHGGKLSGNATQATARDVMTDAIPRLEQAGYQMLMTVHDELVTLCRAEQAGQARKEVENLLTRSSAWSQGIPLGVKISISERYQK